MMLKPGRKALVPPGWLSTICGSLCMSSQWYLLEKIKAFRRVLAPGRDDKLILRC